MEMLILIIFLEQYGNHTLVSFSTTSNCIRSSGSIAAILIVFEKLTRAFVNAALTMN